MKISAKGAAILRAEAGELWAIVPERFEAIAASIEARLSGQPRAAIPAQPSPQRAGEIGVIPIVGSIAQRRGDWFGDTTTDWISGALDQLIGNTNVGRIVLDIDSPGGIVFGIQELAEKIRTLRRIKPIVAVVNSMAASAAYWLASAASTIVMTPGGQVGSIGVWNMHIDESRALDQAGYVVTLVSAGPFKVEGNPWEPLSDEGRGAMQSSVDTYYRKFLEGVAKGRGVTVAKVASRYGQGRLLLADEAMKAGMVDAIGTLQQVIMDPQLGRRDRTADAMRQLAEAQAWQPRRVRQAEAMIALAQAEGAK